MKRLFVFLPLILVLLTIAPTLNVNAQETDENFREGEVVSLKQNEVVEGNFFAFGERVEISGTVNGDVYTAGGQVIVDGTINGDLLAAGGSITISGNVSQDARVAAGQITITGRIGQNLTLGGGSVEIPENAVIGGGIVAGAGQLNIGSPVGRDIRVGAGSLTIGGPVGGDINAAVEDVRLTSKANVTGDLTYWSSKEASIDEAAVVTGEIVRETPSEKMTPSPEKLFGIFAGISIFLTIISLISTLIIGLLLLRLVPVFTRNTVETLRTKPWPSLGIGFLGIIIIPIAAIVLAVTIVGLPLSFLLFIILGIGLYVARIFVFLWFGRFVFQNLGRKVSDYWAFLVGAVIYFIVQFIPIIGGILTLLVILFGFGALLITKKNTYELARKKEII